MITITNTAENFDLIGPLASAVLTQRYAGGIFRVAEHISEGHYDGGTWELKELSNGGFYMSLRRDEPIHAANHAAYWSGDMSPEAFSIAVNMYVSSQLSFWLVDNNCEEDARRVSDNYHLLREFVYQEDGVFTQEEISAVYSCCD